MCWPSWSCCIFVWKKFVKWWDGSPWYISQITQGYTVPHGKLQEWSIIGVDSLAFLGDPSALYGGICKRTGEAHSIAVLYCSMPERELTWIDLVSARVRYSLLQYSQAKCVQFFSNRWSLSCEIFFLISSGRFWYYQATSPPLFVLLRTKNVSMLQKQANSRAPLLDNNLLNITPTSLNTLENLRARHSLIQLNPGDCSSETAAYIIVARQGSGGFAEAMSRCVPVGEKCDLLKYVLYYRFKVCLLCLIHWILYIIILYYIPNYIILYYIILLYIVLYIKCLVQVHSNTAPGDID